MTYEKRILTGCGHRRLKWPRESISMVLAYTEYEPKRKSKEIVHTAFVKNDTVNAVLATYSLLSPNTGQVLDV